LLLKNYIIGIGEGDIEALDGIVERRFLSAIRKKISFLKDKGLEFELVTSKPTVFEIDVFDVQNFYTVGVSQNRKRNKLLKSYSVHDEVLDGNMFHFIIDKDADDTSMVTIYLQYHMNIFTDMSIKIIGNPFFFFSLIIISESKSGLEWAKDDFMWLVENSDRISGKDLLEGIRSEQMMKTQDLPGKEAVRKEKALVDATA
jgi:hypothetical protein